MQRRFAIVHVGVPADAVYADLVRRHCQQEGPDPALDGIASETLAELFSSRRLATIRPIGAAVALDTVRYIRRRAGGQHALAGEALAEAVAMLVLPQLEGLDQDDATRAFEMFRSATANWNPAPSLHDLRARFEELFPHVRLPA